MTGSTSTCWQCPIHVLIRKLLMFCPENINGNHIQSIINGLVEYLIPGLLCFANGMYTARQKQDAITVDQKGSTIVRYIQGTSNAVIQKRRKAALSSFHLMFSILMFDATKWNVLGTFAGVMASSRSSSSSSSSPRRRTRVGCICVCVMSKPPRCCEVSKEDKNGKQ